MRICGVQVGVDVVAQESKSIKAAQHLPGNASALHVVGEGDIIRPDIELPFPQPQHPAVHAARVDADAHVHVHPGHVAHQPVDGGSNIFFYSLQNTLNKA